MSNLKTSFENFLVVKESSIHGRGIFTTTNIPADSVICKIEGEVIDETECVRREEEENNVYIFWNGDNYIDAADTALIKHLNHYCTPNCYVDDYDDSTLVLYAERDIMAGEELTIDYDYEEIYEYCNCEICSERKAV